jgi:hypothetical protein
MTTPTPFYLGKRADLFEALAEYHRKRGERGKAEEAGLRAEEYRSRAGQLSWSQHEKV